MTYSIFYAPACDSDDLWVREVESKRFDTAEEARAWAYDNILCKLCKKQIELYIELADREKLEKYIQSQDNEAMTEEEIGHLQEGIEEISRIMTNQNEEEKKAELWAWSACSAEWWIEEDEGEKEEK